MICFKSWLFTHIQGCSPKKGKFPSGEPYPYIILHKFYTNLQTFTKFYNVGHNNLKNTEQPEFQGAAQEEAVRSEQSPALQVKYWYSGDDDDDDDDYHHDNDDDHHHDHL